MCCCSNHLLASEKTALVMNVLLNHRWRCHIGQALFDREVHEVVQRFLVASFARLAELFSAVPYARSTANVGCERMSVTRTHRLTYAHKQHSIKSLCAASAPWALDRVGAIADIFVCTGTAKLFARSDLV